LHHQNVIVAIHDQARQSVPFAENQPICVRSVHNPLPQANRLVDPASPECLVDTLILERQQTDYDLRGGIEKADSVPTTVRPEDFDQIAGRRSSLDVTDVARIDPEMAGLVSGPLPIERYPSRHRVWTDGHGSLILVRVKKIKRLCASIKESYAHGYGHGLTDNRGYGFLRPIGEQGARR
jgi:hypothetical protein